MQALPLDLAELGFFGLLAVKSPSDLTWSVFPWACLGWFLMEEDGESGLDSPSKSSNVVSDF